MKRQLKTLQHFCANATFRWANGPVGMANQFSLGDCRRGMTYCTTLSRLMGTLRRHLRTGSAVVGLVEGVRLPQRAVRQ
jgi:hypothetical protein